MYAPVCCWYPVDSTDLAEEQQSLLPLLIHYFFKIVCKPRLADIIVCLFMKPCNAVSPYSTLIKE